jgi:hypothetical protein
MNGQISFRKKYLKISSKTGKTGKHVGKLVLSNSHNFQKRAT